MMQWWFFCFRETMGVSSGDIKFGNILVWMLFADNTPLRQEVNNIQFLRFEFFLINTTIFQAGWGHIIIIISKWKPHDTQHGSPNPAFVLIIFEALSALNVLCWNSSILRRNVLITQTHFKLSSILTTYITTIYYWESQSWPSFTM